MTVRRLLALLVLPALVAACPGSEPGGEPIPDGQLVVGVQADDFGGLISAAHIVATVDGKVSFDETVTVGPSNNPSGLPKEILLSGPPGARAEVIVEGTTTQAATKGTFATNVVTRRASTRLVADAKKLLRVPLETRCSTFSAPGGGPVGPTCTAPETCAAGRCITQEVASDQLEDYEPTWATSPPDFCRPAKHGAPELFLGTGQTYYAPIADGQTLQLERGPQGGHHIWIAARMKNLRQSGSRTTLNARLVDGSGAPIAPAAYVFTFDRDEGNYCTLWGLRFQLDSGSANLGADYKRFLGKKLEVTVEVIDSTNAKGTSSKTILIADQLLCPDGTTTSCN